jgi:hypothetical protein
MGIGATQTHCEGWSGDLIWRAVWRSPLIHQASAVVDAAGSLWAIPKRKQPAQRTQTGTNRARVVRSAEEIAAIVPIYKYPLDPSTSASDLFPSI